MAMTTLRVTQYRTLVTPNGTEKPETETTRGAQYGYGSVGHLQREARERWHRHGDTVSNTPAGVRIDYAKPRFIAKFCGYTLHETARLVELEP
jgi:hypothetical protein